MLFTALLFGLLGSFHCIGMCGPIALILPVHNQNPLKKITKIILYHLGRILAYGSIGLLFGFIGKGFYLSGIQQRISIVIGVGMILYVLIPTKYTKTNSFTYEIFGLITKLKQSLGKQLKQKSYRALFTVGFLNGFLPCGMVYMALVGALATGDITDGFVYMAVYGLGTIPLMSVILYTKHLFSLKLRNKIQKAIPVFVVAIGVLFIMRGFGLGIPYVSPNNAKLQIQENAIPCAPTPTVENSLLNKTK